MVQFAAILLFEVFAELLTTAYTYIFNYKSLVGFLTAFENLHLENTFIKTMDRKF